MSIGTNVYDTLSESWHKKRKVQGTNKSSRGDAPLKTG